MIDLSRVEKHYVACGYTDMRRGIDGFAAIVSQQFGAQLCEDSLFLFCGRRTDRIKALYFSGDGYVLLYKRLNNGAFQWPRSEQELRLLDKRSFPSAANNTAAFSQLQAENDALKKENRDLRQKLERMNELLLNAQRARFGPSSEKQD